MKMIKALVIFAAMFFLGCISFLYLTKPPEFPPKIVDNSSPLTILPQLPSEIDEYRAEEVRNYEIKLLTTGQFHGDEVAAKTGEKWLGLFKENDKYFLRYTKIKVILVRDDIVDGDNGKKTGKKVSVGGKNQPTFLLKNAGMLREGSVETIFQSGEEYEKGSLSNNSTKNFSLNSKLYSLSVISDEPKKDYLNPSSKLVLFSGNVKQTLTHSGCADCGWQLYWVGDLDGDEKLDLYANLTDHYNVSSPTLFLSSQAEKGELVKEVAVFRTVGC